MCFFWHLSFRIVEPYIHIHFNGNKTWQQPTDDDNNRVNTESVFSFFLVWIVAIFSWQNSNMLKYSNMLKFSNKLKYSNRLKLSKKSNIQICSNFQICSNIQICLPSFFSSELWPCDTKPCPPDLWVVFLLWYLNICFECVHQTCELYCCCCDVCF